jgi:hypothetical protein
VCVVAVVVVDDVVEFIFNCYAVTEIFIFRDINAKENKHKSKA